MAQWIGQFSGHTHATKVQDNEESLRQAANALAAAPVLDRARKAKAARQLAERLLASRLKVLRARISRAKGAHSTKNFSGDVPGMKLREHELRAQGVEGILKEFGIRDDILE
jgi:hypothetical protein